MTTVVSVEVDSKSNAFSTTKARLKGEQQHESFKSNDYIIQALLPLPNVPLLYYSYDSNKPITTGDLVLVPFRNKQLCAIVWQVNPLDAYEGTLKQVIKKLPYTLTKTFLDFIQKSKSYYLADLGSIAKMILPVEIEDKYPALQQDIPTSFNLPELADEQLQALHEINNTSKPIVLYGVTSSGKTEVYFRLIADVISKGKQALVILPEIALTQQITDRFKMRFGFEAALWHSSVTNVTKKKTLKGIIQGSVKVVIGARSSLFLPYNNLTLIVVDEEHDQSYKQESGIYYNARDMSVLRSHIFGSKIILASATPSIETYYNCKQNKYHMVQLHNRYSQVAQPSLKIVDMCEQKLEKNHWISKDLQDKIQQYLDNKQQVLLFLNRKGYAPLLICHGCGFKINCLHCSTSLVWHKSKDRLECHACGFYAKLFKSCPQCKRIDSFLACGPGIERLQEEALKLFDKYRILVISKEEMSSIKNINIILDKIANYEVDIIIGTQIIAKGYHFPKLNLVGIVDADIGLSNCDLKSFESTFQVLQQVSGRAGRETSGEVLLQTYQKSAQILDYIIANDYQGFMEYELQNRQQAYLPPISKVAVLMITATSQAKAASVAKNILEKAPKAEGIKILGPAPAILSKLKGRYRYNILVVCDKTLSIQNYLSSWLKNCLVPSYATLKIDIDPYSLM
jgi:primosomal protein N' (replication factor Y)